MIKIDNWATVGHRDPFLAPECTTLHLQGNVTGHPSFKDGDFVATSYIVGIEKREILTRSNHIYKLGKIDPKFRKYLKKIRPNWDHRNPITFV